MCAVFQNKSMILWNKNVTTGSHSRLIPSKLFQNSYTIHFSHAVLQWCPCFAHVLLVCLIKSFYLLNYILKQRWVLIWAPNHIMLTTDISWKARPVKNSDILKCCFSLNLHSIQWHFFFFLLTSLLCISGCMVIRKVTLHKPDCQYDMSKKKKTCLKFKKYHLAL